MSLSSFCVVTNALRLNFVKLRPKDEKIIPQKNQTKEKEISVMKDTLKIEGMMCPHCEARVKNALEALAEVDSAEVSHEKGTAEVALNAALSHEVLKATVEAQGYKVLA